MMEGTTTTAANASIAVTPPSAGRNKHIEKEGYAVTCKNKLIMHLQQRTLRLENRLREKLQHKNNSNHPTTTTNLQMESIQEELKDIYFEMLLTDPFRSSRMKIDQRLWCVWSLYGPIHQLRLQVAALNKIGAVEAAHDVAAQLMICYRQGARYWGHLATALMTLTKRSSNKGLGNMNQQHNKSVRTLLYRVYLRWGDLCFCSHQMAQARQVYQMAATLVPGSCIVVLHHNNPSELQGNHGSSSRNHGRSNHA